jgi:EmrB/QacA subfamily drug resistance transporter
MEKKNQTFTLLVFILGIFMGAIDTGIISPSRTIIQNGFNVDANVGIWMITIYTLFFAVSMPIVSKLSDRYGRKKIYLISISIFTLGSVLCGITNFYGDFSLLLISRVIQAIGGGGIIPVATAYITQSFPEEKRGTALGMIGGVFGIATVLGPTIGSFIIDWVGNQNWGWLFLVNLPIGILIISIGLTLKESKSTITGKMDLAGTIVLGVMLGSFMYALTNLKFNDIILSITSPNFYLFLLLSIVLLPIFTLIELRAQDPVLNVRYFKSFQVVLVLLLGVIVGIGLMGVIFIPQFAENILKLPSGKGGYIVTALAVFSGFSAPLGGRLIDKFSAKVVLLFGFFIMGSGLAVFGLITADTLSVVALWVGLGLIGFGMGLTIGAPLNYLILGVVKPHEAASGISTVSLMRSIGTTVAPNFFAQYLVSAGSKINLELKDQMPELTTKVTISSDSLKKLSETIKINGVKNVPDFSSQLERTITISKDTFKESVNGTNLLSPSIQAKLDALKEADVTNIASRYKNLTESFFDEKGLSAAKNGSLEGLNTGATALNKALEGIDKGVRAALEGAEKGLNTAATKMDASVASMTDKLSSLKSNISSSQVKLSDLQQKLNNLDNGIVGIKKGLAGMKNGRIALADQADKLQNVVDTMKSIPTDTGSKIPLEIVDNTAKSLQTGISSGMPANITSGGQSGDPAQALSIIKQQLALMDRKIADTSNDLQGMLSAKKGLTQAIDGITQGIEGMKKAMSGINQGKIQLTDALTDVLHKKQVVTDQIVHLSDKKSSLLETFRVATGGTGKQWEDAQNLITMRNDVIAAQADIQDKITALSNSQGDIWNQLINIKSHYLNLLEQKRSTIEHLFQITLSQEGFKWLFVSTAVFIFIGLLFTLMLKNNSKRPVEVKERIFSGHE